MFQETEPACGFAPFFSPDKCQCFISLQLVGFPVFPSLCSEQTCLRGYILCCNYCASFPTSLQGFLYCQVSEEKPRLKRAEIIIFNSSENRQGSWGPLLFPCSHFLYFRGSLGITHGHPTWFHQCTRGTERSSGEFYHCVICFLAWLLVNIALASDYRASCESLACLLDANTVLICHDGKETTEC